MAGRRVFFSKISTQHATRAASPPGRTEATDATSPTSAKNGAKGCHLMTVCQSPWRSARNALVMPQPGQGLPVTSANGHGHSDQPCMAATPIKSVAANISRHKRRCLINGASQGAKTAEAAMRAFDNRELREHQTSGHSSSLTRVASRGISQDEDSRRHVRGCGQQCGRRPARPRGA